MSKIPYFYLDFVLARLAMEFKRQLMETLLEWKRSKKHKPLVVRGARQTGKTTLLKQFGKTFDNCIYLNLEKAEDAKLFENDLSARDLIQLICLEKKCELAKNTLLFIDEIQNSPKAVEQLRYFYEDVPELFVVCAGSLLEVMMDRHKISFPVGRVEFRYLFPMTFREFLLALDERAALELYEKKNVPEFARTKLENLFKLYQFVGGMPEAVSCYAETKDLSKLQSVFESLLTAYKDDATKYAKNENEANIIRHIIETAAMETGNRIVFEKFGKSSFRSKDVGEAMKKLERAMLLYMRYPVTSGDMPLIPDMKLRPRLQFLDTGLLNYALGMTSAYFTEEKWSDSYRGMLAEQVVGQELLAQNNGSIQKPIFWVREKKQSNAELDFLIVKDGSVIPVEIKSGKSGTLRSLHQYIEENEPEYAIRLYKGVVGEERATTPEKKVPYLLRNKPLFEAGKV